MYSKNQVRGLLLLIIITIIFQFVLYYRHSIFNFSDDFRYFDTKVDKDLANLEKQINNGKKTKHIPKKLSIFDPNSIDLEGWINIGFSKKQAKIILKYKNSINGFKKKEDIKNCYVISQEKYKSIEPFIKIVKIKKKLKSKKTTNKYKPIKKQISKKDINLIRFEDMKALNITNNIKRRILSFRDKLGGFFSMEQINEVYYIKDYQKKQIIKHFDVLDENKIKKISINEASAGELISHPYITKKMVKVLLDFRKIDRIENIDDVFKLEGFRNKKLKKYLKL